MYQAFLRSLGSGYQSQSFLILAQVLLFKIFNFDRFLYTKWSFKYDPCRSLDAVSKKEVLKCFGKFELLEFNL